MERAAWTYELRPTGAAAGGLEDYEARTADSEHAGVVVGLVRRTSELFLLVDAGAMPPFVHRRIALRWQDVAGVDHTALVVQLAVARAGLEDAALALDPKRALHGPGAEAARVTTLPAELTRPLPPGTNGPAERGSAILLAFLAAAAPFSLFAIMMLWIARGLAGWEYGLLAIPFVLAALTLALEGYRLYREPHLARSAVHYRPGGNRELILFAIGGGVLYLTAVLGIALALGQDLPLLGWVGFAIAATVVLAASTGLAVFLVRASGAAGSVPPVSRATASAGVHRVLVVADEGCSGAALCRALADRLPGGKAEVLVVAPALVSPAHYLDSDLDLARAAAQTRVAETVSALTAAGIAAHGEVGSESPLEAIADTLAVFAADEIIVATPPPERTNWLEQDVIERARELYTVPVSHLVLETPALMHVRPR